MASIIVYLRKSYVHFQFVVHGTFFFFSFLFWFNSRISLTTAMTNMKLGREMKLCDPTNIGMCKQFISWKTTTNNLEQYIIKVACIVEIHCGRRNLIHG